MVPCFTSRCADVLAFQEKQRASSFAVHLEKYLETAEGMRTGCSLTARIFEMLKLWKAECLPLGVVAGRAQTIFDTVAAGIELSDCAIKPVHLWRELSFFAVQKKVFSLEAACLIKNIFLQLAKNIYAATNAALFIHETKIASLGALTVSRLGMFMHVSIFTTDSHDLFRDCVALSEVGQREEELVLGLLRVVKNVTSIASEVLVLIANVIENVFSAQYFSWCLLSLSLLFLATKISEHFYERMVVEPLKAQNAG